MKRVKVKPGEDLSEGNVEKVISSLDEGCTKKHACSILGIAYNTKRLSSIIEGYKNRKDFEKKQRAKMRGKPIDPQERASIIQSYLESGSMESVARGHWRSVAVVKKELENCGALLKGSKKDYFNPLMVPDICVSSSFNEGELVWSSRYNCVAEILKYYDKQDAYKIWVHGSESQFAIQATEDLGSLAHLADLGVNIKRITS